MNLFRPKSPLSTPARFRALYEKDRLSVFRYIYGLTGGPQDDVEDLTAETFLRAWKARHQFQGDDASATGWLIRIAKRLVIDQYRRTQQQTRNTPTDPLVDPSPEQTALQKEQTNHLYHLLADIADEPREILILRYLLGWRVSAIAVHLGMTENNVSVTIHRTLARLRERWLEYDVESLTNMFVAKEQSHETYTR